MTREEIHPQLRYIRMVEENGGSIERLDFHQEEHGLSLSYPEYFVTLRQGPALSQVGIRWTSEIEMGFRQRVATKAQEVKRGAFVLGQSMERADRRWGEGFVSSVFRIVLEKLDGDAGVFRSFVQRMGRGDPSGSSEFRDCSSYIEHAVTGYLNSLVVEFGYSQEDAGAIFVEMLRLYLDRRFNISARQRLFGS